MPREGEYGAMIGYYLIISVVAAGIQLFWHMVLPPIPFSPIAEMMRENRASPLGEVMSFLFSPVLALVVLYIVAGVAHILLKIVGGQKYGFETTTRVVAFSHSPAIFVAVPYLGPVVGGVWSIVLAIIGFREAHETTTGRATAAVLLPLAFLFGLIIVGTILALAIGLTTDLGVR